MSKSHIAMPIKRNWETRFLLKLLGFVKVSRIQRYFANLANPRQSAYWQVLKARKGHQTAPDVSNLSDGLGLRIQPIVVII